MMATLVKTAYSPNIKERRDCSTGIFDAQGRLLALTAIAPLHLSSLIGTIESVLQRFPIERMRPDDAFVVNDPYNGGGSHLPDITMVAPVFSESRLSLSSLTSRIIPMSAARFLAAKARIARASSRREFAYRRYSCSIKAGLTKASSTSSF